MSGMYGYCRFSLTAADALEKGLFHYAVIGAAG